MAKKSSSKLKTSDPSKSRQAKSHSKTKKQTCIELLKRPKGASLAELQKAIGWQAHSVRGLLSGTVRKLNGVILVSEQAGCGERRYRIKSEKVA